MKTTLLLLADLSYQHGLIGLNEYAERLETIDWLTSTEDSTEAEMRQLEEVNGLTSQTSTSQNDVRDESLSLLALKKWMFTIGDADCFPSVPHGHLNNKNGKTKLNPYTGYIINKDKKEIDRLTKAEMYVLWSDPKFRNHCREQINWYTGFAPEYLFPDARKGRLSLPKWRKR
ncbi:hypothetical protein [Vibrio antiquarius]|uniref:hypothetical protein n=1 Tax=Vibrio antiquarius (strain Ex25) TaxID=150340 RepID=UPI00005F5437|nr:hypothetical protein [Vibrio antiquarius]